MSAPLSDLALRLADEARSVGLTVVAIEASRHPCSATRHLRLRDAGGRLWCLRVSDHERRQTRDRARPNLNLIVLRPADMEQAARYAGAWMARVAAGGEPWHDPTPMRNRR